ncbi:MAG: AAA family ATPase, partial [Acidithiobacillus sp.]
MLTRLEIRNFALIESLELELAAGMTVLTGETGAGKSIVVDAISQILGDKASADLVRFGAEQAEIAAGFSLTEASPARQWLRDQGLDDNTEDCIVRRLIPRQGRSRAFINGRQVAGSQLRELGEYLVELL